MNNARGGIRKNLIMQTWNSILVNYSRGKYYATAVLLRTITNYLGIKIPDLPFTPFATKIDQNYVAYCERNLPLVSERVDQWLSKHKYDNLLVDVGTDDEKEDEE